MISKRRDKSEWEEGYLNNVWCKFKTFLSPDGDLYVVARRDATIRVFRLKKKVVEEHKDEELNHVMKFAEEVSKIPKFIPKDIFEE